jgi:hypothetical protein
MQVIICHFRIAARRQPPLSSYAWARLGGAAANFKIRIFRAFCNNALAP